MDVKRDILWRVYLSFFAVVAVCIWIFCKAFYIQQVEGKYWRSMSDSMHQKIEELPAQRGTIYSDDGQMLSTSIPQFDVFVDFGAEGLREKNGQRFREHLDSLSYLLAKFFGEKEKKSQYDFKKFMQDAYKAKLRHSKLLDNISYRDLQALQQMPLVRLGRYKSGFIIDKKEIRLNPYKLLASRTIGLDRDSFKVGLEMKYDSVLSGKKGKRLVRYIAGGVAMPVEDYEVEPEVGKDIVTTLNMHMQEITEDALMKMMVQNEAEYGCAVVMEVATGKIKAIANLGRSNDGMYRENMNYAIIPSEPGSTFKLATLIAALEDKKVSLNSMVDLNGGVWQVNGETVYDSEQHGLKSTDVKHAFEASSNVGMAKLAYSNYATNPMQFINHLQALKMDTLTGIDLTGERKPIIYKPGTRNWSSTTLPWMAFGYNLTVSPLHTAMLYNAVANDGKMMKPFLVSSIKQDGITIQEILPVALNEKICSKETLIQLKACLEGVCTNGTAKSLFKNTTFSVAGKTGTALVANGSRGYADKIYQSSFAGYFPAQNPKYTIVVVIKNKPHAVKFYGADVAGPVFREIAERLFTVFIKNTDQKQEPNKTDSAIYQYTGLTKDVQEVMMQLQLKYTGGETVSDWSKILLAGKMAAVSSYTINEKLMPQLKGMGLKDAITICENIGLKINVKGRGKVTNQSIAAGQMIAKGQLVQIELN